MVDNFGVTQGSQETYPQANVTQETQPQETMTQQETQTEANVIKQWTKKGAKKEKEKQIVAPKMKRPVRQTIRIRITINGDPSMMFDSSSDDDDFEAEYMVGHRDSFYEVGDASHVSIQMSAPNEI